MAVILKVTPKVLQCFYFPCFVYISVHIIAKHFAIFVCQNVLFAILNNYLYVP